MRKIKDAHNNGCFICGKELIYSKTAASYTCDLCGKEHESNIICPDDHFICDKCHGEKGELADQDAAREIHIYPHKKRSRGQKN